MKTRKARMENTHSVKDNELYIYNCAALFNLYAALILHINFI